MKQPELTQRRTILGTCEYTLHSLLEIKRTLMNIDAPNQMANWAIGGLVITLMGNLMRIIEETMLKEERQGALEELIAIQSQFNNFIDAMKSGVTQ